MQKIKFDWTHLLIIFLFLLLSVAYFYPVIEGKTLEQGDIIHARGVNHYGLEYAKKTGHRPCWSPQLFSGMPSYQVSGTEKNNFVFITIHRILKLLGSKTIAIVFLYFLGFYILMLTLGVEKWLAFLGAVAYGFSTYNIIIIGAGHITKAYSLGYMPLVVAGYLAIYKEKYWLGGILALLSLGIMINLGHFQIIYYTALLLGLYVIIEFIFSIFEKRIKQFLKSSLVALTITILAILPNTVGLWQAYEMSKYSIRGPSELKENKKNTGLDKDYALSWSYGISETWSIFIPNIKGGASGYLGNNEIAIKNVSPAYRQDIANFNQYWGNQPFTSGPVYFGAVIIALAFLGLFFIKDQRLKIWLIISTILSIILAWGKNFPLVTDFFFYHFPYYNKFRTVSMILVIAALTIPMLGVLGLNEFFRRDKKDLLKEKNFEIFTYASIVLLIGIPLLFFLFPNMFNFLSDYEIQNFNQYKQQSLQVAQQINLFIQELESARKAIFIHDVIRTLFYVVVSIALLVVYFISKDKTTTKKIVITSFILLVIFDLMIVDKRYLNNEAFVKKSKLERNYFNPTFANKFILKDKDPNFRVVNITVNPFTDAITSYHHFNIGGYHGAKLRRYQDLIENYLAVEIEFLRKAFTDTITDVNKALAQTQILNMLNTKYIIFNPQTIPYINKFAFGNAWFVKNIKFVNSPKEEMESLQKVNLKTTAVIDKSKFGNYDYPDFTILNDLDSAWIKLSYFSPDTLEYEYYTPEKSFVVFSEIYYPKGWKAYIDGKEAPIVRANYVLRGMTVPAGKHKITMIFAPKACYSAQKIALVGSILVVIFILGAGFFIIKNLKSKKENE